MVKEVVVVVMVVEVVVVVIKDLVANKVNGVAQTPLLASTLPLPIKESNA